MSEFDFLEEQGVSAALIKAAEEFRQEYGVSEEAKHRRIKPALPFYGKETLEMAMAAVLEQENLLLAGPKATGKNVLAENLAYIFGRPVYNVSFHVNTNSGDLIGTDTFVDNQVKAVGPIDVSVQMDLLKKASKLLKEVNSTMNKLSKLVDQIETHPEGRDRAVFCREKLVPAMEKLREPVDELEMLVDKDMWPMPSYGDLVFEP